MKQIRRGFRIAGSFATVVLFIGSSAWANSGTWNGTQDAIWTNSANWSASPFPSGSQTATFDNAGNGRTVLDIGGLAEMLNITFTGSSVAAYTIGNSAQQFLLQAGGEIRLTDTAANSQTINANLQFPTGNSSISFRNDNPGQTLTFNKVIGFTTAGATKSLYLNGTGPITVQGDLDRDQSGLNVYDNSTNTVTLGGNAKLTQLYLDGTNAVIGVGSGKTLTFSNAGGANLVASQDATLNGPGKIVLSANSTDSADNAAATGKTLTINAQLTGAAGFEYYHASYYGTIVLNGANDYAGNTLFSAPGTLQCSAIGNRGTAGSLGAGTNILFNAVGSRLRYTGAGETTDRILDIRSGGIFEHAGSGSLAFISPTVSTTSGNKTLVIRNFAAAAGEFRGAVQNGSGTVSLAKEGDGTWSLSASNTFSGTLSVNGGTLLLTGTNGAVVAPACTVSNNATLLLSNTAAVNNANRLANAGSVTLSGGTLAFTHDAGAADFSETTGALTIGGGSNTVSITAAASGHTSVLTVASLSRTAGTVNFVGAGLGESVSNRIVISGQPAGMIGAWATINGSGIAAYDTVKGVYDASSGSTSIAARGPSTIPDNASLGAEIDTDGTDGPIALAGEWTNRVLYVRQNTATAAEIATRTGETNKTLLSSGLAIRSGGANLTVGSAAADGTLSPLSSSGTLVLQNDEASAALTVNADLVNNGSASSLVVYGPGAVALKGEVTHTGTTTVNTGTLTFGGQDVSQRVASVIGGSGGIAKSGTNLLHLTTANTYTGPTTISEGIVRVNLTGALGTSASGTVIADGATLDVGGAAGVSTLNLQSEPIAVSGAGTDGQGAIVNNSANEQWYATGNVSLNGDTTFGGLGRWDIRDGTFAMNNHALTKKGSAWFALSQTLVTPGGTNASIDVQAGTLRVQRNADFGGSAANTLHLRNGTTLNFYDVWSLPSWRLVCESNTSYFVENSSAVPRNFWYGPVVLNGTLGLTGNSGVIGGFAGAVSGTGALIKAGAHSFSLTGTNNTYGGTTIVSNGTLFAAAPGSLPGYNDGRITVVGGATLAVQTGDGQTGFSAESLRDLNASAKFLSNTAILSVDTAPTSLAIPYNLSGYLSLSKQGTNTLSLGGINTNLGNIAIYAGQLSLSASNNQNSGTCYLEGSATSNALLRLTAGASLVGSGDFSIRNNGALYMEGGTFTRPTATEFGERFAFGFNNGGYGYLKMNGGTLTSLRLILGTANNATAGYGGTGIARFTGGTAAFSYIPHFGSSSASIGVLTVDKDGTFLKTGGECWLAYEGGRCEVNLTGGLFDNNGGNFRVGNSPGSTSATGIVNLCAGRFANAQLNRYSGVFLMNFCGGTFAAGSDTPTELLSSSLTGVYSYGPVGSFSGDAVFDSTGRGVTVSSPIQAPTGQGVYAVALSSPGSGYIGEPYVQIRGGGGDGATAVANLTDDGTGRGTFKVGSVTITCPGFGYTSSPAVTFLKGGAGAIAATGTVSLAQNVSGGLTKIGNGTLTLAATNTYGGATTVSNGTLRLGIREALPRGTDIRVAGGVLDLGGFAVTNGDVSVLSGSIVNGSLVGGSFIKTGDGTVTLAVPLASASPISIERGTLRLVSNSPGLYEGPLAGSFNTTESISTNILIQLTTRMANTSAQPPWTTNITYVYTGYLWNRAATNVTWTFGENIDDSALLKIDGTTVLNNGSYNTPTIGTVTLTPGTHAFEARFGNGGGPAGKVTSAWWTTTAFGFGIDYLGRNETNIANFVALADPGDGSLLTVSASGTSNLIADASSVEIAAGAILDLAGITQTLASLSGSGTVSNGTLAVTGDITPGGDGTVGTLTVADGNVLGPGTLRIDVTTGGDCDRLIVKGDIDLSNLSLVVANPNALVRNKTYTFLTCSGTRTGTFKSVTVPDSRWHVIYRSDGTLQLLFVGGTLVRVL
jgi:autotransporter-associated beta strand protein